MAHDASVSETACHAAWCAGDDWCAVTCTMEVIGNKWHPVIVHRLLAVGPIRFNELADEIGTVTNKVLSESLTDLQEKDVVERTVVDDQPVEIEYALTERGESLESVIESLEAWGKRHLDPADGDADDARC